MHEVGLALSFIPDGIEPARVLILGSLSVMVVAVAKAGLEALTRVVAKEELGNNIHVNAIAPGLVETEMGRKLVGVDDMKSMYPQMPFGRVCQPEDIANMVLYLVSEEGSYIQGQVIHINGGGKTF